MNRTNKKPSTASQKKKTTAVKKTKKATQTTRKRNLSTSGKKKVQRKVRSSSTAISQSITTLASLNKFGGNALFSTSIKKAAIASLQQFSTPLPSSINSLPNLSNIRRFTTTIAQSLFPSSIRQEQENMAKIVGRISLPGQKTKKLLLKSQKRSFSSGSQEGGDSSTSGGIKDLSSNADPSLHIGNFDLHPDLVQSLTSEFNITNLFPIQAQVMKPIQQGLDLFGKSKTGTGKTLAFLLPMIDDIVKKGYQRPQPNTAPILIMEPTRELALQVSRELEKLNPRIRVATLYGGSSYEPQRQALRSGCHIIVATPGRLMDLADSGSVQLGSTERVVLDEADEMLRLGFQQNVEQILQQCDPKRQTILFSATLPNSIQSIVRKYTNNVQFIDCAAGSEATPSLIKHKACMLPRNHSDIPQFVFSLFRMYSENGRAIVFSDTKAMASELETLLNSEAKSQNFCAALHGDVSQSQRENILQRFREGKISMLLATDVAARGIDIPSVDLVVQLGIPRELESYVHRSGRTGRAGKHGTAVLCYRHNERDQMGSLSSQTGVRFSQVVREDLKTVEIDDATIAVVERAMGSGYQLFSQRFDKAVDEANNQSGENMEDENSEGAAHDPAFAAAMKITQTLTQRFDPKVLLTREIYNQLRQKATGGSEGTPFSLLTSTPLHTTIAFPPNESVPSISRRLSADLGVSTQQVRMLNQTYTNNAVLVDVPDDIFNSMKPLIDDQTIDYIQIPRKLPTELFVGGQVGQGGGNRGGGGRQGGGGFGGNRQGGGGYQGNRPSGGYQGGGQGGGGYQGNRPSGGGYQGGGQGGGGYQGNRPSGGGYQGGGQGGGYQGNRPNRY